MNLPKLFHVALTATGTYRAEVIAFSPDEAASIAKTILFEETFNPTAAITILERKADAASIEAETQPERQYDVTVDWLTRHSLKLPAHDREQATTAVRRMIEENQGPFELNLDDSRLHDIRAREVV